MCALVSLPGRDLKEASLLCVVPVLCGLSELVAEELIEGFAVIVHSLVRR